MIVQILLSLTIICATHAASFDPCPDKAVCLFFAKCTKGNGSVLVTTNPLDFKDWESKNCSDATATTTHLFVQQQSEEKWVFTLTYTDIGVGIGFEKFLKIMANHSEAIFREPSAEEDEKLTYVRQGKSIAFTVSAPGKKLLDIFKGSQITYDDVKGSTSHSVPDFWKRLAPCAPELIIDGCTGSVTNCTNLEKKDDAVTCQTSMWLKSTAPKWIKLDTVICDSNKDWQLTAVSKARSEHRGKIICAEFEPEPWTNSETPEEPEIETKETSPAIDSSKGDETTCSEPTPIPEPTTKLATSVLHTLALPIVLFFAHM